MTVGGMFADLQGGILGLCFPLGLCCFCDESLLEDVLLQY